MIEPMLARPVDKTDYPLSHYLSDPTICMQYKADGVRMLIEVDNGVVRTWARSMRETTVPANIKAYFSDPRFVGLWQFDGEYIDNQFYVFDIMAAKGSYIQSVGYLRRYELLHSLFDLHQNDHVKLMPTWTENKQQEFERIENSLGEGVIFRTDSPYVTGRTSNLVKHKFVKDADCFVTGQNIDGKQNFQLSVYDDGNIVNVGEVSALQGDAQKIKIGDVVKVSYLYFSEGNRLVQPNKPYIRHDKSPQECTLDQMITTRKDIVHEIH